MAKVELKQPIVQEIAENIKDAQSVVIVDYRGLTVAQDTQLRKQLREAGITYKVYKNTLIRRAAEGTDFAALDPHLEGPTAIAVSRCMPPKRAQDDVSEPVRKTPSQPRIGAQKGKKPPVRVKARPRLALMPE